MFNQFMFFIYIFAAFMGCSAIGIIVLLWKHREKGKTMKLYAMYEFLLCSLLIGVLYFFNQYFETAYHYYIRGSFVRALDISLFIMLQYFWIKFIWHNILIQTEKLILINKIVKYTIMVIMALSVINYMFFMDSYYYIEILWARYYATVVQILLCIVLTVINLLYLFYGIKYLPKGDTKIYIIVASISISLNGLWNGLTMVGLIWGILKISSWNEQVIDPTALLIMICNLATLIYVFKHDFSPIYFMDKERITEQMMSKEELIGKIATEGYLTKREREVLHLVFLGKSNETIADELCISINTVKHHIYNLYRKLGISTRMELVTLVNNKNST